MNSSSSSPACCSTAGLAASLIGGPHPAAGPRALPGRRDAGGLGRPRLARLRATTTSRETIGVIALALILFEGGLTAGFEEIRPVLRPAISLALFGTLLTAAIGGVAAMVLFDLSLTRACCSARSSPPPTARPSSRCCAPRRSRSGSRARSRARPASTTPSPSCSCSASSSGSSRPTTACWTCSGCSCASSASAPWSGVGVGWLAVQALQARAARHCRPVSGGVAGRGRARLRRRRGDRGLGLPRRLPRRPRAGQREHPGKADDHDLPRGARLGRAADDVPRARPADLPERRARRGRDQGHRCSRSSSRSSPGRSRPFAATAFERFTFARARGARLGRAARRGADRARAVPGDRAASRAASTSSTIVFFAVLRLDAAAGDDVRAARAAPRADHRRARPAAARIAETGTIRRLGAEVVEYPVQRRRRHRRPRARASSSCRARRSST